MDRLDRDLREYYDKCESAEEEYYKFCEDLYIELDEHINSIYNIILSKSTSHEWLTYMEARELAIEYLKENL